jgi:hypothetical protein
MSTRQAKTSSTPWGPAEKAAWLAQRQYRRSYASDVLASIEQLRGPCEVVQYGELDYPPHRYPLYALKSPNWRDDLPLALITGGVHGYETSGVHGALGFARDHLHRYAGRINILVAPCVSPWAYETIQRWNPQALDPNRSFRDGSGCEESAALLRLITPLRERIRLHVDLHETTDSDESEFRPALAERDGVDFVPGITPDGFYVVDDADAPRPAFQSAIIEAVARVTHIAQPDAEGRIIGAPVVAPGVIQYPVKQLALCAGITDAEFRTTTEVYPDSPRTSPAECTRAQVTAVGAALAFVLQ